MHRIDPDLERLQPVAVDHALEREGVAVGRDKAVEMRKCRRLARPEIGEKNAALLHHRIGFLLDVDAEIAVVRLGRCLKTLAIYVEQPAVEGATQAAILEPAICEIGAAVRAAPTNQAIATFVIPEDDQVFTEQSDRLHRTVTGKLVDQRRGLPVAPHQSAGRCPCPGPGDEIVLLDTQHGCAIPYLEQLYTNSGKDRKRGGPENETAGTRPAAFQTAVRTGANGAQPSTYPYGGATLSVAGPSDGLRLSLPPRGWPPRTYDTRGRRPAIPKAACEKDGQTYPRHHSASGRQVNLQRCQNGRRQQRGRS